MEFIADGGSGTERCVGMIATPDRSWGGLITWAWQPEAATAEKQIQGRVFSTAAAP